MAARLGTLLRVRSRMLQELRQVEGLIALLEEARWLLQGRKLLQAKPNGSPLSAGAPLTSEKIDRPANVDENVFPIVDEAEGALVCDNNPEGPREGHDLARDAKAF
ncbi:MAG: hypothetical protein ABDI20_09855 [Candidatus Bipolaricaulaceae bacterium]